MKIGLILLLMVAVGIGAYRFYMPKTPPATLEKNNSSSTATFTLAQVAEHADKSSCWIALEGKVYDVTPFVAGGLHPGKDAILAGCGKDATELFNNRPGGSGAHSERARAMLPKYLIGELSEIKQ